MNRTSTIALLSVVGIVVVAGIAVAWSQQRTSPSIVTDEVVEDRASVQTQEEPTPTPEQIIELNRKTIKTLSTEDGTTFVEIRIPEVSSIDVDQRAFVELWRVDTTGFATVMHSFTLPFCGSFEWGVEDNYVRVTEMTSPCEAFAEYKDIVYSSNGERLFTSDWNTSWSGFTFSYKAERGTPTATISVVNDPLCADLSFTESGEFPQTMFTGVELTRGQNVRIVDVSPPVSIDCGAAYGDAIVEPKIGRPTYDGSTVQFDLPAGYRGTYDLSAPLGSELTLSN